MSQDKDKKNENNEVEEIKEEAKEEVKEEVEAAEENKEEEKKEEPKAEENEEKPQPMNEMTEEGAEKVEESLTQEELEAEVKEDESSQEEIKEASKEKFPEFKTGDTIRIHYKIIEADKTRIQPFEGIVIAIKGKGNSKTFTMRRIGADGVGVERIIPMHSPNISKIEIKRRGKVRKSKLYYLRKKKGRAAVRVKDRV